MAGQKSYDKLKARLLDRGLLFEDTDFPASSRSIGNDKRLYTRWRRPSQISSNPKFVIKGSTRFDLNQGELGNCWFVAGAACLATSHSKLFERVVPPEQSFDKDDYAGIFRFYFWHFDKWIEVVVDDRLPTVNGQLLYCRNTDQPDEFWAPLMEKAYAKVYGSYQNIDGGFINDALVDFTGGISETMDIRDTSDIPADLFEILFNTMKMNSMMGCAIDSARIREEELPMGLYGGHAYSITNIVKAQINGKSLQILRLRNPWGRGEWKGAWSDKSREWRALSEDQRRQLGLVPKEDGEFWMPYDDFLEHFERLSFCHLYPDALTGEVAQDTDRDFLKKKSWNYVDHHAKWVRGFSAGGCGMPPYENLLWTNPQFAITLTEGDDGDDDGRCTIVVSLMQKSEDMQHDLFIGFQLYRVKAGRPILLDGKNYDKYALRIAVKPAPYKNVRERTFRYRLKPATYVIIPSTFKPNKSGAFLLRINSEKAIDTSELDEEIVIEKPVKEETEVEKFFKKHAGGDAYMDDEELMAALNEMFDDETERGFGIETARTLMAMMDRNEDGMISDIEFRKLVKEVTVWKTAFKGFDKDRSGSIDTNELTRVFETIGFKLSRSVVSSIVRRYGGKKRTLSLEDFVQCCSKVLVMYSIFSKKSKGGLTGKVEMDLQEWLATTLYY